MKYEMIFPAVFFTGNDYADTENFPTTYYKRYEKLGQRGDMFEYRDTQLLSDYEVGDHIIIDAGAPGYGSVTYKVTEVNELGVFGNVINNNIQIFDPEEANNASK